MSLASWKLRAHSLKAEVYGLYLAFRDPRTPWYAKAVIVCVVAYALSPVDLIPDFIPFVGYLDDLVVVPLGIMLAMRLIPGPVREECRTRATQTMRVVRRWGWAAAGVVVALWLLFMALLAGIVVRIIKG